MVDFNKIFGQILKEKRQAAGLSQDQLAVKVQVSRASIANYEAGSQGISLEHAVLIATELNLSLDHLKQNQHDKLIENELKDLDPKVKETILKALRD
ncbi:helix-turn-helix transcriptional regulator [Bdellovibrio sp.]|uniref:helix-turn-helix domain-containing protein n=1 Tax=Bdellovibrio sp. TaxID=28201 RepID=UPI003222196D